MNSLFLNSTLYGLKSVKCMWMHVCNGRGGISSLQTCHVMMVMVGAESTESNEGIDLHSAVSA